MNFERKIYSVSYLPQIKKKIQGKKIVLVGGCFDLFHFGHFYFLMQAKKKGDILVILLESDAYITFKKNRKSVHTQKQRATLLSALEFVDYIILLPHTKNRETLFQDILSLLQPSVIALTKGDVHEEQKEKLAKKYGARILRISYKPGFSSSRLIHYASIFRN